MGMSMQDDTAPEEMSYKINSAGTVAVDQHYYWQEMDTCPQGVKVQLLNPGGVAIYGTYRKNVNEGWLKWAPLPKIRPYRPDKL